MIICGFAGIGKSYVAKTQCKWIDLESTPFEKDWERYVKVAKHMSDNGYVVLLSCHKELRELLHKKGINYNIVMPNKNLKLVYLTRYKMRGNTEDFIDNMDLNWDNYTTAYPWENCIRLKKNQYLENVMFSAVTEKV